MTKEKTINKYMIKKEKTDMVSSLNMLDKKVLKEKLEEHGVDNVKELAHYIIDSFESLFIETKDDFFTQMYFSRLYENQDSMFLSAYESDIEDLLVFVYENGNHLSYYIPNEIKKIIKKELNL